MSFNTMNNMKFILKDLKITPDENDFAAIPSEVIYRDRSDLIKQIIKQEGTILKETETQAGVDALFKFILKNFEQGIGYRDDVITITPTIQGVFNGSDDRFDRERHTVTASLAPGTDLKLAASRIEPMKIDAKDLSPKIETIRDLISNEVNGTIAARSIVEINGDYLKLDPEDQEQGVFLVNTTNGNRIRIANYREVYPKRITLLTPSDLPAGTYNFEVRATFRNSKSIRIGKSTIEITVA
ncbi:DUF4469 domain-containing protein [Marinilabiliaceae bacterium JC017]|nr:DUF4469 domain-containing protein [Marinilabiliaceae bacterium JC017]